MIIGNKNIEDLSLKYSQSYKNAIYYFYQNIYFKKSIINCAISLSNINMSIRYRIEDKHHSYPLSNSLPKGERTFSILINQLCNFTNSYFLLNKRYTRLILTNHIHRFFSNHNGRCIGIAINHRWHNRSINHTQVLNPINP